MVGMGIGLANFADRAIYRLYIVFIGLFSLYRILCFGEQHKYPFPMPLPPTTVIYQDL